MGNSNGHHSKRNDTVMADSEPENRSLVPLSNAAISTPQTNSEKDPREELKDLVTLYHQKILYVADEMSLQEAHTIIAMLSGLSRATSILGNCPVGNFRTLNVQVGAATFPTFLDTRNMTMQYNPPYFPDCDVGRNSSALWRLRPQSDGLLLVNFAARGAYPLPEMGTPDIVFGAVPRDGALIMHRDNSSGRDMFALYTTDPNQRAERLYLVPITAVVGHENDNSMMIVHETQGQVTGGNVFIWQIPT